MYRNIVSMALAAIISCLATTQAVSALVLIGTPTYSIDGTTLSYSSTVLNTGSSHTETIRVEMWAFNSPFPGPTTGYRLAISEPLNGIAAGSTFSYSGTSSFVPPPPGTWVVALIWTEHGLNNEQADVFYNFAPRSFLGAAQTLSVPAGLVAKTISANEITLRWNRSTTPIGTPAASYQIYADGIMIGSATSRGVSITDINPLTTYQFWVAACDAQSNCSSHSNTVSATTFAAGSPSVANFTALWWNSVESGWGLTVSHQGNTVFGAIYTYDSSGSATWFFMPAGIQQGTGTQFVGDLYAAKGPPFNSQPFTPITSSDLNHVGTMTLNMTNSFSGTLSYTVNGSLVVKNISKLRYGSRVPSCSQATSSLASATNYQDLWWNPNEAGWGLFLEHQDDTLFGAIFTYDSVGKAIWYSMSAGVLQPDGSFLGDLYRTHGPAFNAVPFNPISSSDITKVGTMRLSFTGGSSGTLTYSVDGAAVSKTITRDVFASPPTGCVS